MSATPPRIREPEPRPPRIDASYDEPTIELILTREQLSALTEAWEKAVAESRVPGPTVPRAETRHLMAVRSSQPSPVAPVRYLAPVPEPASRAQAADASDEIRPAAARVSPGDARARDVRAATGQSEAVPRPGVSERPTPPARPQASPRAVPVRIPHPRVEDRPRSWLPHRRQQLVTLVVAFLLGIAAATTVVLMRGEPGITPMPAPQIEEPVPQQPLPASGAASEPTSPSVAESVTPPPPEPSPRPVRFVNPFDRSEVFEFPPGTTESQARDAVARRLLDRARERLRGQG